MGSSVEDGGREFSNRRLLPGGAGRVGQSSLGRGGRDHGPSFGGAGSTWVVGLAPTFSVMQRSKMAPPYELL
jgi:hypothetical protein